MSRSAEEACAALLIERMEPLMRGPLSEERKQAIAARIAETFGSLQGEPQLLACGCRLETLRVAPDRVRVQAHDDIPQRAEVGFIPAAELMVLFSCAEHA